MTRTVWAKGAMAALGVALVGGLAACTYTPAYHRAPPRYVHPPYYYDYYYYPNTDVYFHIYSGRYYYHAPKRWVRVKTLPKRIYLDHRYRVPLRVWNEKPYAHHREHRDRYRYTIEYYKTKGIPARVRTWDRSERQHNRRRHDEYHKHAPRQERRR